MASRFEMQALGALEANTVAFHKLAARLPKSRLHDEPDLKWVYTGTPAFNRVFHFHQARSRAASAVDAALAPFREWRVPVSWGVGPSSHPEEVGKHLEAWGMRRGEDWDGMVLDLEIWRRTVTRNPPTGFVLEEVVEGRMDDWAAVVIESFGIDPGAAPHAERLFASSFRDRDENQRHFLGLLNGTPVSAGMILVTDQTAGMYWLATRPDRRNAGIGRGTVTTLLDTASKAGLQRAALHSTPAGKPMYLHLGFETVGVWSNYYWKP